VWITSPRAKRGVGRKSTQKSAARGLVGEISSTKTSEPEMNLGKNLTELLSKSVDSAQQAHMNRPPTAEERLVHSAESASAASTVSDSTVSDSSAAAISYKQIMKNTLPPVQHTQREPFIPHTNLIVPLSRLDLQRCVDDYEYYAANLLKIKTIDSELKPLIFNHPQQKFWKVLTELRQKGKLARIIVLKARREGISTISEGLIFHAAHMNENTEAVIIAHEKDSGNKIFNMCKLFYDCLPPKLRPMTKYASKKELVFSNPDKQTSDLNPGLRSSVEVVTAGKKDVSRGAGYHLLHCSEVSSWPFATEVVSSLVPTIPKTSKSLIIYESTAKGIGNFFHREWERAENGDSNFVPFFLSWFDMPDYTHNFYSAQEKTVFMEKLNDEEQELMVNFQLTPEQLYWRRVTIADLEGDVELFRQEFPSTAEEAFIVSGVPVFDRKKLRIMAQKAKEPTFQGEVGAKGLLANDQGSLKVWNHPQTGQVYSLGVDVADGGEGGDYSCIQVWKKLPNPYTAEQCAEWHGHLDPYNLAHVASSLGNFYNNALIGVETNAHGLATLNELQRSYWNLYRQEHFDRYKNARVNKLGWETTNRSKKLLISFMTHCISDLSIIVHSNALIRECMTFLRTAQGTAEAQTGGHDDRVMSAMIGLFVLHQQLDDAEDDIVDTTGDKKIIQIPKTHIIDQEFASILEYGVQNVYEQSWLNY